MPTHLPRLTAFSMDLRSTATTPNKVMYLRNGVLKTTEAAAPTNGQPRNVSIAGILSKLAKGSTPWGGPVPIQGDFSKFTSADSSHHTKRYEKYLKRTVVKLDLINILLKASPGKGWKPSTAASTRKDTWHHDLLSVAPHAFCIISIPCLTPKAPRLMGTRLTSQ